MTKRTTCRTLAAILAWAALSASSAQAKFVAVFERVGSAVEEVGGGTIDLTDLSDSPAVNPLEASIAPVASFFISGASGALGQLYRGVTGPRNFGPGDPATADQSAGDIVELSAGIGNSSFTFRSAISPETCCPTLQSISIPRSLRSA
jgi:hypothetical protein